MTIPSHTTKRMLDDHDAEAGGQFIAQDIGADPPPQDQLARELEPDDVKQMIQILHIWDGRRERAPKI